MKLNSDSQTPVERLQRYASYLDFFILLFKTKPLTLEMLKSDYQQNVYFTSIDLTLDVCISRVSSTQFTLIFQDVRLNPNGSIFCRNFKISDTPAQIFLALLCDIERCTLYYS